jgi:ribonuclease P protein component
VAPRFGLPRSVRLRGAANFRAAFAERQVIRGRWLVVHRRAGPAEAPVRLGLVIGKRYCREANRRNLLKRLIREHYRQTRPALTAQDLVFRLARPLPDEPRPRLRMRLHQELAALTRRLIDAERNPR